MGSHLEVIDLMNENTRLTQENAALKAALMSCRTSYVGYAITSNDQYAQVIDNFWRELQRIDKAARAALKEPGK